MRRLPLMLLYVFILTMFISCEDDDANYASNKVRVKSVTIKKVLANNYVSELKYADLSYSGDKLIKSTITDSKESGANILYVIDYEYNSNIVDKIYSKEYSTGYAPYYKIQHEINGENILTKISGSYYSDGWYQNEKIEYTYSGNKMQSYLIYEDYFGDWDKEGRVDFSYDGDKIMKMTSYDYDYSDETTTTVINDWHYKDNQIDYVYTSFLSLKDNYKYYYHYIGSQLNKVEQFKCVSDAEEVLVDRISYAYDANNCVVEFKYELFNSDESLNYVKTWEYAYESGIGNYKLFDRYIDWKVYTRPYIKSGSEDELPILFPFNQKF